MLFLTVLVILCLFNKLRADDDLAVFISMFAMLELILEVALYADIRQ